MKLSERFWSKVDKKGPDDCWEWTACTNRQGYGKFGMDGKMLRAHRVAYDLEVGEIPDGMDVCHRCDNPGCVNPAHLFLGTRRENIIDMCRKGRNETKLTKDDVFEIVEMYEDGYTQASIASQFGVSQPMISLIVNGKSWAWLTEIEREPTCIDSLPMEETYV